MGISLGWTNSTDSIKASSYYTTSGSVQIAEGKSLKDEKGYVYRGTLTKGQVSDLKGQKLEPFEGVSVSFVDNFSGASDVFAEIAVDGEGHVSAPSKHPFHSGKTFIGWFTSPEGDSEFDFTVKVTENTTAYAHWNENTPVEYIDENGGTKKTQNYILLTNDIYVEEDLPGGWYVVEGEVKYTNQVTFNGEAHLILADGAKMEIETEGESEYGIYASNNLTIYGQNGQRGILKVKTTGDYSHGIYSEGNITISGGTVADTATGSGSCGIYSDGNITIIGGKVTATSTNSTGIYGYKGVTISGGTVAASGSYGIGSGGTVEIKNGSVTASGSNFGIYSSEGKITISGGKVTATSTNSTGIYGNVGVTISGGSVTATGSNGDGIYSYNGNIILGWTNSTDNIKASSYYSENGSVFIAEGKSFKDENGIVYSGTLTGEQLSAIKGKTLEPCYAVTFDAQNGDEPIMLLTTFDENGVAHVAKPNDPIRSGFTFEGWFAAPEGGSEFDFTKAVTGNTTAYAHWNENTPVEYIDENGKTKTVTDYTVLTENTNVGNLPEGWYVVLGEVSYGNSVNFGGDAHLILADEAKLEIVTEGEYENGINANGNLNIYGQSEQSGILNDSANGITGDGISSYGNITISGGSVTATGLKLGIYSVKNVTIRGGTVEATGKSGTGIYSFSGNITINGGTVEATGLKRGIYSMKNVTISGGSVTATGNDDDGIYSSEGNITLGWTNSTDSIKASSYYGKNGVSIAEGKSFKDENGIVYSGTLTGEQLSAIKGKTLEPCYAVTFNAQNGDEPIMLLTTFDENGVAHVAKPNDPIRSGFTFEGWFTAKDGNTEFDFSAAITGNTTAYAKWGVPYIDENGKTQIRKPGEYTVLTENTSVGYLPEGWYVVQGEVKYTSQVMFSGDAHLILADGAEMVIKSETYGILADKNLTIYGQNGQSGILNDTAKGTNGIGIYSWNGSITISGGSVTATGDDNGIYGSNGVKINGGSVTATGDGGIVSDNEVTIIGGSVTATGINGNGIFGDNGVTISGGSVTAKATGINGNGIYGHNGVTISGGTVEATGSSFGIYGDNGVKISGGSVTATGNNYGISSVFGDITLGWTNSTDSIKVSSIHLGADSCTVSIAKGKSFVDENGNEYRDTLTDENLESIKNKTLTPPMPFPDNIVIANISGATYTGDSIRPEPVVTIGENVLELGKDYTLAYKDNLNASETAKVIVKGAGKYYGEVQKLFTIDKAPLKITALNDTIVYGDEPASAGVAYDGFVGNETSEVLKGELTLKIGYKQYDDVGKYAIMPSGLKADNYEIDSVAGTLTVEPKVISIVWGEQTVFAYDGEAHAPTVTTEDFVEGHEASLVVTGAAVEVGNDTAKVALDEKNNNSKNYKLPATGLEKEFKIVMPIAYIDENGKTKTVTDYTVLTENTSVDNLDGGWYVVQGEVKYTNQVTFYGDAHLILADGATMTIEGIYAYGNLTIYGQSEQRGTLNATAFAGIYSKGTVTINGGTVTATGENNGIYSDGGNITISGGTVLASGKRYGIYSDGGNITISGGSVTATGTNGIGIYSVGTVEIKDGSVTATGGSYGIYSREGNITLSWTNSTDFITASSYYSIAGSVQIAEGKSLKDEKGNVYSGTLTKGQVFDLEGQKLEPFEGKSVSFVNNFGETPVVFAKIAIDGNGHVAAPAKCPIRTGYTFAGWFTAPKGGTEFSFSTPIKDNTTAYAHWNENTPVEYIDENGVEQTATDYTVLTNDMYVDDLSGGWYVVEGDVKYTHTVSFSGDAHLILADGAKMEIEIEGIYEDGINATGNLTIYGQSGQSGTLKVSANVVQSLGIYGYNEVSIIGGTIEASGAVGIFAYNDITISGGTVVAFGSYGIGSVSGDITLGWTNSSDFIYASSYSLGDNEKHVSIAKDKSLKDENGKEYSGMIEDRFENGTKIGTVIDGKTLVPPSFEGKILSDVNIAVADIPVQKYADGKPVCPSVVVTDGKDTLTAGTDYTVTCFNNTAVTSATLDEAAIAQITGKGNYAGAIQKRFFIWNNIRDYAAVQVFEDADGNTHAEIDGAYDGTDAVAIDEDVEDVAVKFNREFTPNKGFATIMLPFDINATNLTGVKSIIRFAGIFERNGKNAVGMKYVWCDKDLGDSEAQNNRTNCNELAGELKAYTPYMVEMKSATLGINGGVTLKSSKGDDSGVRVGDTRKGDWVFRGALQKKVWSGNENIIQNGRLWAFAASARDGTSIGKFVQFGGKNWVNPFRAYLVECPVNSDGSDCEDDSGTQPKASLVSRYHFADVLASTNSAENSLSVEKLAGDAANSPAVMRQSVASETASLNGMDIVLVDSDKDSVGGKEHTTVIGRMNPATGEIRMLPRTTQTYDLKGRRVGNGKKAKGAYFKK